MKKILIMAGGLILALAPLAAQTIQVISPNGGESWALNTPHTILWTAMAAGNLKVDIILRNSGGKVGVIKSQVPLSQGSWPWTLVGKLEDGTMVAPGTDYIVRIRDTGNTCSDDSNANFTISGASPAPTLRLLSPNGGERWILGEFKAITWKAENWNGGVNISIRKPANCSDSRQSSDWEIYRQCPAASGQFVWQVGENHYGNNIVISADDSPKMLGGCNCFQIIITSADGPSPNLSDQSDGNFYICRSKVSPIPVPIPKK
jgi:hypothetical protein